MLPRSYYDHDLRKKQIDTLKIFNDNVLEISENEYKIEFSVDGKDMTLDVVLGPEFPNEKPTVFITPALQHPWIADNSNQVTGAPGLVNFSTQSDLGRVVRAIIREMQNSQASSSSSDEKSSESSPQPVDSQLLMFPELNDLSIDELQEVLENTDLQDKILVNNPELIRIELETQEVMNSIEEIAHENLFKQQMVEELKTDVIDRIETIVQMKMNCEQLHRKHQQLMEMFDPHKIRENLRMAALKADEEAEVVAELFLLGKLPVETFVAEFAAKRALGQARRAREERLAHQLNQLDKATT